MSRFVCMLSVVLLGAKGAPGIEIGQSAGPLKLCALDGRSMTMENYAERKGTVALFLSSRSSAVDQVKDDINRIHQQFRLKEVLFVGVCSNPGESGEELRIYAQRCGMVFPIYQDSSGDVARRFGATVTPQAFLLDTSGVLRYRGSLMPRGGGGGLAAAISDLLAGRSIEAPETVADGVPIAASEVRREIDDPYGSFRFSSELIFSKIPGAPAHHCSTIVEAANGDLLAVWYGGSYESSDDQVLFIARRKSGGHAWGAPEVLLCNPGQPPGNAIIFKDARKRLWVVWGRMESTRPLRRGSGWGQCRLFWRTSDDNGESWSVDRVWPGSFAQLPRNVPITLKTGELLLPMSGRVGSSHGSFFFITKDSGETWERSSVIPDGSQPTVAQRADGSLLTLMRNTPRLLQSESRDGGRTWSPPTPTKIKNPDAGIAMAQLANGHLVLVFNDTEKDRTPLSIARSVDGGGTWEEPLKLEANPGEYSYPCMIQTSDGLIHITYTYRRYAIKHVELDEDWLIHLKRPN